MDSKIKALSSEQQAEIERLSKPVQFGGSTGLEREEAYILITKMSGLQRQGERSGGIVSQKGLNSILGRP